MQTEAGPRAREFSTHLARALAMKANGGKTPTTKLIALKLKEWRSASGAPTCGQLNVDECGSR